MTKYNCEKCAYFTDRKSDYTRHLKSKKHQKHQKKVKENLNGTYLEPKRNLKRTSNKSKSKIYICQFCNDTYSTSGSFARHRKVCGEKSKKDEEIERIKREAREKEEQYKRQLETYEELLRALSTPQTINNFTYINNAFPNAPALEGRTSYNNLLESKKMSLMEVLTMYNEDKRLVSFVGDYIIKYYKKNESTQQSMWSSDISRLTYIISQACSKKGNVWKYDKKGHQTRKIIIEPALDYIRQYCFEFCQNNGGSADSNVLKQLISANSIIEVIDSGELAKDIVKYIAPEFALKYNDNLKITN